MKLKLLKDYKVAAVPATETEPEKPEQNFATGDVIEIEDQATYEQLIADGTAQEQTAEMDEQDKQAEEQARTEAIKAEADKIKLEQKSFKAVTKSTADTGVKTMKGMLAKAAKEAFETKAVSAVAGTTATEVMGYVTAGNKAWDKLSKMSVKGNLRIVYINGAPTISTVSEGATNAQSGTPIAKTATPVKKAASFTVPSEYFDDLDGLDAYLSGGLQSYVFKAVIGDITDNGGTVSNSVVAGLEAINGSADAKEVTFADLTAPTKAELLTFKNTIHPDLRDNIMFILGPAFWAGCESALLTEGNIGNQLITIGKDPTMFGYPVVVTESATAPIVGDFSKYRVGVARDFTVKTQETVVDDAVVTNVSIRVAGAIGWKADANYAAFAYGAVAQG